MKLYRTPTGRWCGTQADARQACSREDNRPDAFEHVDVPTDKPSLIAFLNELRAAERQREAVRAPIPAEAPERSSDGSQASLDADKIDWTANRRRAWDAQAICEFLQSEATQAQVEEVFASIGARWGEARGSDKHTPAQIWGDPDTEDLL